MARLTDKELQSAIEMGIINMDDVRDRMKESKKQKLLSKHTYDIWQSDSDEEYIRNYATVTFRQLYLKWLESKSIHTNSTSYIKRINTAWNAFYRDDPIADMTLEDFTESFLVLKITR